ncbi:hypothetical protein [Teichococcus vastitatis]|uniref:Uncharacterized protein n=1 Tax=Teichococcus vastitatis TaxID=2307076 RepID=A0ABS9WD70_9PROT|nr:hypothetical protein [Pseudoroseomonas vastitatis]MCI0756705.1 hypothetical protein [Pseudoroseomonas vastitatis]
MPDTPPDDPMQRPARERPGNHPNAAPGEHPDPRAAQPGPRPGEPDLQGGPAGAGSTGGTGDSRG